MAKAKKITKKELEQLNSVVAAMRKIETAIGQLRIQESKAISDYASYESQLKEEQKALEDKYGNITIDLNTGEYQENVEEAEEVTE